MLVIVFIIIIIYFYLKFTTIIVRLHSQHCNNL